MVAVRDLDAASRTYERLGFRVLHRGGRDQWGLDATMLGLGWGMLELIAVVDAEKPVAAKVQEFLDTKGEGVYMLSISVDDAQAAHEGLRVNGIETHPAVAAPAVDGFDASLLWLRPAQTHGVLLELIELRSPAPVARGSA